MSANIAANGTVTQLDRRPEPDENITVQSVKDGPLLARFLLRLFRTVSTLKRRWSPNRIDFRGLVSTGTSGSPVTFTLKHNFNGAVAWWITSISAPGTIVLPFVTEAAGTDANTLVVGVYFPATLTIRVEEAG